MQRPAGVSDRPTSPCVHLFQASDRQIIRGHYPDKKGNAVIPTSLQFLNDAEWHATPPVFEFSAGSLDVVTGDRTDFWQDTFYGFCRDNGHFYGARTTGDFTAVVTFDGQ